MRIRLLHIAITIGALATGIAEPPIDAQSALTRSTWDGVYTAEQAARGEQVFVTECLSCHGAQLEGNDAAPSLAGGRFMSAWNGVTLADMLERMRVTMPLIEPGKMSRQQTADVMAYMLSVNGFPAGEYELPRQSAILRGIAFESAAQNADAAP